MSEAPSPPPASGSHDALLRAHVEQERQAGRPVSKIPVIKYLREATGLGLKEAKDAVESFGLRHQIPELQAHPIGAGCVSVVVLLIGVIVGLLA